MLPRAFKGVLFLDVFGWVSQRGPGGWVLFRRPRPLGKDEAEAAEAAEAHENQ